MRRIITDDTDARAMRRWIIAVFLAAFVALTASVVSDTSDGASEYTVSGTVADGSDGLGDVLVTIVDVSGVSHTDTTDASGAYSVSGLTGAGSISISFKCSGYTPTSVPSGFTDSGDGTYAVTVSGILSTYALGEVGMSKTVLIGYVLNAGDDSTVPLDLVLVTVTDAVGNVTTAYTDSNGMFSIAIGSIYDLKITFMKDGYFIIAWPTFATENASSGEIVLSMKGTISDIGLTYNIQPTTVDGIRTYTLKSETSDVSFKMSEAVGSVNVEISDASGQVLRGATVKLQSSDGMTKYSGTTDYNGSCVLTDVSVGDYKLVVTLNGFEDYDGVTVDVTKGSNSLNVVMEEKSVNTFMGITNSHILMVIAIVIGSILIVIGYLLCTRTWRPKLENRDGEPPIRPGPGSP